MSKIVRLSLAVFSLGLLTACGSTRQYVEDPPLAVRGAPVSPAEAVTQLFVERPAPYVIELCEADPSTGWCSDVDTAPSAKGLGGLFLPLVLELEGIVVAEAEQRDGAIDVQATLRAPVNKAPSKCGTVSGTIMTTSSTASLRLPNNYCNWLGIGNVVQTASLSIDAIELVDASFTGYYKISFYGTGNARGSGYYRARIVSDLQASRED